MAGDTCGAGLGQDEPESCSGIITVLEKKWQISIRGEA